METVARRQEIVLIGPIGAGKSTVGWHLARRLKLPQVELDAVRWPYYNELGYDTQFAQRIRNEWGFWSLGRYWKPFEAHTVERALVDHADCIVGFGAGHSVQEHDALRSRLRRALAPFENVVLLLPSADPDESIRVLRDRIGDATSEGVDATDYFVRHDCNRELATLTVYTEGKTPEQVCEEVIGRTRHSPSRNAPAPTPAYAAALFAAGAAWAAWGELESAARALHDAHSIRREFQDTVGAAACLTALGSLAYLQDDLVTARRHYEDASSLWRNSSALGAGVRALNPPSGVILALEGHATLALADGDAERALRLCGAAGALRASYESHGIYLPRAADNRAHATVAEGRRRLDAARCEQLSAEGRAMTPERSLAYALAQDPSPRS